VSQTPSIGRIVHYVSYGSPVQPDGSQVFKSECRAAIVTAIANGEQMGQSKDEDCLSLCVLNPTGQFFNEHICHDEQNKRGGTWHWPERT
jgi:hypothetical protein